MLDSCCLNRLILLVMFVLPASTLGAQADEAATRASIDRITAELLPTVVFEGEEQSYPSLRDRMQQLQVPGLGVAVIHEGEIAWARGFGLASIETETAVGPETLFQAASISKPVAAMAALALVEQGRLDLDRAVNDDLEHWKVPAHEWSEKSPVTLRGLLTHSAGLTVHGFPGYPLDQRLPSTIEVLQGKGNTGAVEVDIEPRTRQRYSGGGYTVMQLLVKETTGKSFPAAMQELVLGPLGMKHSSYGQPLEMDRRSMAAMAYDANLKPVSGGFHAYPEMAAAGLWTTPSDLARFLLSIQKAKQGKEHPVLSKGMIDQLLTPDEFGYGLGPAIMSGGQRFGHGGANHGYRCYMMAYVDQGEGAVIMTNSDRGGQIGNELLLAIAREYGWPEPSVQRKILAKLSEAEVEAITGDYQAPPGVVTLTYRDGRFWGKASWDEDPIEFLPESKTKLVDRSGRLEVVVTWTDDDRVEKLTVQGMDLVRKEG